MDQFLERHNLPKLTHKEIDYLSRTICIKETETFVNNLPQEKNQAQMGLLVNSTKHLRKKLYQFSTGSFEG